VCRVTQGTRGGMVMPAANPFHASPEAGGGQEDGSQATFTLAPHLGLSPLSRALGGGPSGDGLLLGRALVGGLLAEVEEEAGVGVGGDLAPEPSPGVAFP
jgi:hypothetical protein